MNSLSFEICAHGGGSNGQISALGPQQPGRVLRGLRDPGCVSAPPVNEPPMKPPGSCGDDVRGRAQNRSQGPATTTMMWPGRCAA